MVGGSGYVGVWRMKNSNNGREGGVWREGNGVREGDRGRESDRGRGVCGHKINVMKYFLKVVMVLEV